MIRYSIIIPSSGKRPLALGLALDSVFASVQHAKLDKNAIQVLVGFDGMKGERVRSDARIVWVDFPADHDFGNAIRNGLLCAAKGERIVFLDDDNALTLDAFSIYGCWPEIELFIGRIDVSRAHTISFLPREEPERDPVYPGNIDPLCLCLSRDLVVNRCRGWLGKGYEADFLNIVRYSRRAHSRWQTDDLVGIYDAGVGLDLNGTNFRTRAHAKGNEK